MLGSKRVLRITLILISALILTSCPASAQEDLKDKVSDVFELIYNYQLISADSSIDRYEIDYPNHPVWSLLRANVTWWQILSGGLKDNTLNKEFEYQLNESKTRARQFLKDEDEAAFSLIIVNAFRTRYDLLNNNYLTAAGYLNACIDDISDSFGREEQYEPFYLTSGLYYYFTQKAHEDYPLMRPYLFFFPDGDKEKGLNLLKRCSESEDIFLREEATYFLMRIALDMDKDAEKALLYLGQLLSRHPNNIIFRLFEVNLYEELGLEGDRREAEQTYLKSVNGNFQLSSDQKTYFQALLYEHKKAPK